MTTKPRRADHQGPHRQAYEKNRQRILKTEKFCALCGREVDFSQKYPEPLAPVVDHIIPIAKGGHPSDIANLQLTHAICNREKGSKIQRAEKPEHDLGIIPNNILPWSRDWTAYREGDDD